MYFIEPSSSNANNMNERKEIKDLNTYKQIITPTLKSIKQEPVIESTVVIEELENNKEEKSEVEANNVKAGESQYKEQRGKQNDKGKEEDVCIDYHNYESRW